MRSLFSLFFILFSFFCFSQAGSLDTTFNEIMYDRLDNGQGASDSGTDFGNCLKVSCFQTDGKILVGGGFYKYNGLNFKLLVRLNADGSLDKTFKLSSQVVSGDIYALAIQTDGKIIVGGDFILGSTQNSVIRLNADGSLDLTFNLTSDLSSICKSIKVLSDGKILISRYNSLRRLNPDGSIDITFNSSLYSNDQINCMNVQSDGKIIIAGNFTNYDSYSIKRIARLHSDGTFDDSFNIGNGADGAITMFQIQDDGKIVVLGNFYTFNNEAKKGIVRLNYDGSIDNLFSIGLGISYGNGTALKLQSDGKILVGGSGMSQYNSNQVYGDLFRLNSDGSFDRTFTISNYEDVELQTLGIDIIDNKILVFGCIGNMFGRNRNNILKLDFNFNLDNSFNQKPGIMSTFLNQVLVDNYGKILLSGNFNSYNDTLCQKVIRLTQNGYIDNSFNYTSNNTNSVQRIAVQADDKILICDYNKLIRVNSNGTIDNTFSQGNLTGSNTLIKKILVQADGKIILIGTFNSFNNFTFNNIIRLNSNGTIDNTFISLGTNSAINVGIITAQGKIIIGGTFTQYNNQSAVNFASINIDGSIDVNFSSGTGVNSIIRSMILLSDQKILIGGDFSSYNGNSCNEIARINSDGTYDNSFSTSGLNNFGTVNDLVEQIDGKIIVVGNFNGVTGINPYKLKRLNNDGSTDLSFTTTIGSNKNMNAISLYQNKIIVIGDFTLYENQPANHVVMLNNDISANANLNLSFTDINNLDCDGMGSVTAFAQNGNPPFSYHWHNFVNPTNPNQTITSSGIFTCTVTDFFGYSKTASLLINEPRTFISFDLNSNLIATNFRPGFSGDLFLDAYNDGCIPTSGQLKLITDPQIENIVSNPIPNIIIGDTLIWNFDNLIYDSIHFVPHLTFQTSNSAQIGDSVAFTTITSPSFEDFDTLNNIKKYNFPVVNGYDPNMKSVYPKGKCDVGYIKSNQLLTYTIKFQNTGNSEAIKISLIDSFSNFFDLYSIRIVGQSHPVWTEILENNKLKFHFDSIHLIDSTTNESLSHGYIIFEVKLIDSLLIHDTEITNSVDIYFDYNLPITTNTVKNLIYLNGDIDDFNCFETNTIINENNKPIFKISPNPTNSSFTLQFEESKNAEKLAIYATNGQKVHEEKLNNTLKQEIKISHLEKGIYFVEIGNYREKIIVE